MKKNKVAKVKTESEFISEMISHRGIDKVIDLLIAFGEENEDKLDPKYLIGFKALKLKLSPKSK